MTTKRIQLGLIHVAVAISLVPFNSTLNRVMIKELALSTLLVAALVSLPYLFSPIQVAIGGFSDKYPIFGWKRTPYIALGLILCVAGLIAAPKTAFLIVENRWLGILLGTLVFGSWGMGYNLASVSYFSLATEISGERERSRTIAVMFFMMIVSIILTSLLLGNLLETYTAETLNRAFTMVGILAAALGAIGLFRLEPRSQTASSVPQDKTHSWKEMFTAIASNRQATRFFWYLLLLLTAILGQDILLEPYGAEAFGMSVQSTTRITAIWGTFFLISLSIGAALEKRVQKITQARVGAWIGLVAFGLIVISGMVSTLWVFYLGVMLLGLATGLSTVSNLSLMLDMTSVGSVGLFIGAWGMASAVARLVGNMLSGAIRESFTSLLNNAVAGYSAVFIVEIILLIASLLILRGVDVNLFQKHAQDESSYLERAVIASEV
ncbi:MAG TPA: BCD family MFS transporter [Anaerolineales bacterium]|jgi:BCD family chlorophyll transporter-like MFS transporter|nr:BCD family MFS transporter [Anaerolineales bacterium]